MRFLIDISGPEPGTDVRTVTVHDSAGAALPPTYSLPGPGPDEAGALGDIRVRAANAATIRKLGGALFKRLLGPAWVQILRLAGVQPIQLELRFDPADRELASLPWEGMHDGVAYLAERMDLRVNILRRIRVDALPQPLHNVPMRVLFVVGCAADPQVHGSIEILGIVQRLRDRGIDLHARVVLDASGAKLAEAISVFRPGVVHFIAHGAPGVIELATELPGHTAPQMRRYGEIELLHWLRGRDGVLPLPAIVVVSACDSATEPVELAALNQPVACLSCALVRGGVPMVVGMAGRISDDACRMFAYRFYESLFAPGATADVVGAAADGRRAAAAVFGGNDVDWLLPRVHVADGLDDLSVRVAALNSPHGLAVRRVFGRSGWQPFCDRVALAEQFVSWLHEQSTPGGPRHHAFALHCSPATVMRQRRGLTWALHELAARAVFEGFVPVRLEQRRDVAMDIAEFVDDVRAAVDDVVAELGAAIPGFEALDTAPAGVAPIATAASSLHGLGVALAPLGMRPLLVIDAMHMYEGIHEVFGRLFRPGIGLGVPGVVGFVRGASSGNSPLVVSSLEVFAARKDVLSVELSSFREVDAAYLQYLLARGLKPAVPKERAGVLRALHRRLQGYPAGMSADNVSLAEAIETLQDAGQLVHAP